MQLLLFSLLLPAVLLLQPGRAEARQPGDTLNRLEKLQHYLQHPDSKHIMVVAHRADWRNAPENSLSAIRLAVEMGVDVVEIDVRRTSDGQLIVLHDKTLDRTTTGKGAAEKYTLAEIKKLSLKNGYGSPVRESVPTLEEALAAVKGKALIFIDKAYTYLPQVYKLLQQTGTVQQALMEGIASIEQLHTDYPDLAGKLLYQQRLAYDSLLQLSIKGPLPVAIILENLKESAGLRTISPTLAQKGCSLMASTLWSESCNGHDDDNALTNPEQNWGWVLKQGINMICTDRPALLLHYLKSKKQHD